PLPVRAPPRDRSAAAQREHGPPHEAQTGLRAPQGPARAVEDGEGRALRRAPAGWRPPPGRLNLRAVLCPVTVCLRRDGPPHAPSARRTPSSRPAGTHSEGVWSRWTARARHRAGTAPTTT